MRILIPALTLILALQVDSVTGSELDAQAHTRGQELFELVTTHVEPVSLALERAVDGPDPRLTLSLKEDVQAPLTAAIDAYYSDLQNAGQVSGNPYFAYSDCALSAEALGGLTEQLMQFNSRLIAASDINFDDIDVALIALDECGAALDAHQR